MRSGLLALVKSRKNVALDFSSVVADVRVSKQFGDNKITVGGYFSDETYKDTWYLGNSRLLTATPHGEPINFAVAGGR